MNTSRYTRLLNATIMAFAQGLTFGFGFQGAQRDYKAGRKAAEINY